MCRTATTARAACVYGYHDGKVDKCEAYIVREIFGRFADGASCRTIAAGLNARRIPSPGPICNRTERRAAGWMGSGIRIILRDERYRGVVYWNTSEWRKDPDTGKRKRIMRPRSEWISYVDELLRIVSDDLWQRAQRRSYGCSTYHDGHTCSNSILVRRDRVEKILLAPIRDELLAPERVARIAEEMQRYYVERMRAMQMRAAEVPDELQELTARIERLCDRLKRGDPDMTIDELQAAIDRAEGKRRELEDQQLLPAWARVNELPSCPAARLPLFRTGSILYVITVRSSRGRSEGIDDMYKLPYKGISG